jgi:hypothetical protein
MSKVVTVMQTNLSSHDHAELFITLRQIGTLLLLISVARPPFLLFGSSNQLFGIGLNTLLFPEANNSAIQSTIRQYAGQS